MRGRLLDRWRKREREGAIESGRSELEVKLRIGKYRRRGTSDKIP